MAINFKKIEKAVNEAIADTKSFNLFCNNIKRKNLRHYKYFHSEKFLNDLNEIEMQLKKSKNNCINFISKRKTIYLINTIFKVLDDYKFDDEKEYFSNENIRYKNMLFTRIYGQGMIYKIKIINLRNQ